MQLNLIDSRDDLRRGSVQELFEVGDDKVGHADVSNFAGSNKLLHLAPMSTHQYPRPDPAEFLCSPGINKVPVLVMLLQILWNRRTGPVHEIQVDVIGLQVFQGGCDTLLDTLVPRVVKFRGDPYLFTGNTRVDDSLAHLGFIPVRESAERMSEPWEPHQTAFSFLRIDVAVAGQQSVLDRDTNCVGLRLPGTETDTGHLRSRVQGEHRPARQTLASVRLPHEYAFGSVGKSHLVPFPSCEVDIVRRNLRFESGGFVKYLDASAETVREERNEDPL